MKATPRPAEPFWLTPDEDTALPVEQQSRFKFRPLTQAERMHAYDDLVVVVHRPDGTREQITRTFQVARAVVLDTLLEAENFPAGAAQRWPAMGSRQEKERWLDQLDDLVLYRLGEAVQNRAALPEPAGN